jgi:SAM-dependent methyltransferase
MTMLTASPTRDPYDVLAPVYDELVSGYDYERWFDALVGLLGGRVVPPARVLDVACGTGKSTLPWLQRGYDVVGCDVSGEMLAVAEAKLGGRAPLVRADMRALPRLGSFDVVACLDDALNHLDTIGEVEAALSGMAANLSARGVLLFDVNTLAALRAGFSSDWVRAGADTFIAWRGIGSPELAPGGRTQAVIEAFRRDGDGRFAHSSATIAERHHPLGALRRALSAAGLDPIAVRGQLRGARLQPDADEERDHKVLFAAARVQGPAEWLRAHGHEGRLH